jgi:hypothetical protein
VREGRAAPKAPDVTEVRKLFEGLAELLLTEPEAAREALAEAFEPLGLRPLPGTGRGYRLEMRLRSALVKVAGWDES